MRRTITVMRGSKVGSWFRNPKLLEVTLVPLSALKYTVLRVFIVSARNIRRTRSLIVHSFEIVQSRLVMPKLRTSGKRVGKSRNVNGAGPAIFGNNVVSK